MKRLVKAFLYSCLLTLFSLFSVSLLWNRPVFLTGVLAIVSVILLLIWKSKEDIILYLMCGSTEALLEAVAIASGAWHYAFPNFIGIPYWLPFLWGIAAVTIKKISFEIHDFIRSGILHNFANIGSKNG